MASNKRHRRSTHERGLTLLELLLAIGLISVIIAVTILLFANARAEQRDAEVVTKVHGLQAVIKQVYQEPNFSTISGPVLAHASSVAHGMADSGGNLVSPWGKPITVNPGTYGGNTGSTYELSFSMTPTNHCIALVRDALVAPFLKVTVGTTVLKDMSATPPVVVADLDSTITACQGPGFPTVSLISS